VADIEALPADLRPIGRRIDGATRASMEQLELQLRCEWVLDLESRALSENPDKALRTRKLAERAIRSLSDYAYSKAQMELSDAMADASRRQDTAGAYKAMTELRALETSNPRLPHERLSGHAMAAVGNAIEAKIKIPPPPSGHSWARRKFGRKR
jgi:hypothetical protein